MPCILHIETTTAACSVALSQDTQVIHTEEDLTGRNHATLLGDFVKNALSFADSHAIPVDAIAVSGGPGSYTGLRIGTSMAKGLVFGLGIPLIALSTLRVLATPVLLYHEKLPDDVLLCPMLDARRMEVYSAIYDHALTEIRPTGADVVTLELYKPYLDKQPICFFGSGAEKCKSILTHPNALFLDNIIPHARYMQPLAEIAFRNNDFADAAYYEPHYLKEFVAGKSRDLLKETRNHNSTT